MAFKDNLYYFRTKANLTQQQLAEKVGVAQQNIGAYELGVKTPSIALLKVLAETFGCTTDALIYGPEGTEQANKTAEA